jgi:pimeloyl-ACP methyl ester carboxylesterase
LPANQVQRFEYGGAALVDEVLDGATSPRLVLLHGWGASRESLRAIGALFQTTHRVHLLDLPGFGDAPPPPPDWDTARYADLVERFLMAGGADPVVLVGHSFGGRVALRVAARRPPPLRGLVLMGVPGLPAPWWSRARLRRSAIRGLRRALSVLRPLAGDAPLDWHTARFGSRDYLAAGVLKPILVRAVNEDLTACARAVACPVLLLYGSDDTETPPWIARRYRQLMGGRARLVILPHKEHHLYTGTGAHLCAFLIRQWLAARAESPESTGHVAHAVP